VDRFGDATTRLGHANSLDGNTGYQFITFTLVNRAFLEPG
jgi:hypothetical protein